MTGNGLAMDATARIIERYYHELWNQWRWDLIPALIDPALVFRGSLGTDVVGQEGLRRYMEQIRAAFPDFHNTIDALIVDNDRASVRLTYTGTHSGPILGFPATGQPIRYAGAAFFSVQSGRITQGWVLGDLEGLRRQLAGRRNPP